MERLACNECDFPGRNSDALRGTPWCSTNALYATLSTEFSSQIAEEKPVLAVRVGG